MRCTRIRLQIVYDLHLFKKMVMNRKAISPVVATALLLVVAVVAVVAFQTWFNNFQSGQLSDVEQRANAGAALTVERLESDQTDSSVYVRNAGTDPISINSITLGDCATDSSGFTATASNVTNYTVTSCSLADGTAQDVVLVTADGVFQANLLVR